MRLSILLLSSLLACSNSGEQSLEQTERQMDLGERVQFAPLSAATERTLITLPAEVVTAPRGAISLSPPVEGLLTAVFAREGLRLEAGDPIGELEIPSLEEDRVSEPLLKTRIQQQQQALATAQRRRELGLGSVVEIQETERNLTRAEAEWTAVRTRLQRAERLGLEKSAKGTWLWRSTQSGSVSESHLRIGMAVSPADHLLDLVDAAITEIRVALPERYLSSLDGDVTARFMARGAADWSEALPMSRRGAAIDRGTRTLPFYFRVPETTGDQLLSGRTGRASVSIPTTETLYRVPRSSVTRIEGSDIVFRAEGEDPHRAERIAVEVVGRSGEEILIRAESLEIGDAIAVRGVFLLKSLALLNSES